MLYKKERMKGVAVLGFVIGALVAAVVFGSVIPTIADNTIGISGTGNVTGATATLIDLVPLFVTIGVLLGLLTAAGLKVSGKI